MRVSIACSSLFVESHPSCKWNLSLCDDYAIPPQLRIYDTTMADALLFSLRLIPENGIEEE